MVKLNFMFKALVTASAWCLCSTSAALAVGTTVTLEGVVSEFNNKYFPNYPDPLNFGANSLFKGFYTDNSAQTTPCWNSSTMTCTVISDFSFTFGNQTYTLSGNNGYGIVDPNGDFSIIFVGNDIPDATTFNKPGRGSVTLYSENRQIKFSATGEMCIDTGIDQWDCDGDENGESWFSGKIRINQTQTVPESGLQSSILALGMLGTGLLINQKRKPKITT